MESTQRGWKYDAYFSGMGGDVTGMAVNAGKAALEVGGAIAAVNAFSKKLSKDGKGIFDRVYEKSGEILAEHSPFLQKTFWKKESGNSSSNSSHNHRTNNAYANPKEKAAHLNTPYSNIKPDEASESICYIVALLIFDKQYTLYFASFFYNCNTKSTSKMPVVDTVFNT